MSDASPHIEWYLAREGEQYGPLSDSEMRKFVELGHLRPTDLVWRHGFPDWRPAASVFPQSAPAPSAPARPAPQAAPRPAPQPDPQRARSAPQRNPEPQQTRADPAPAGEKPGRGVDRPATGADRTGRQSPERGGRPGPHAVNRAERGLALETPDFQSAAKTQDDEDYEEAPKPRRFRSALAVVGVVVILAAGGGWFVRGGNVNVPGIDKLRSLASRVLPAPEIELRPAPPAETLRVAPFTGIGDTAEATDQVFQQAALWRVIKTEFPEWYDEHLKEAVRIKTDQRDDAAVAKYLVESVVALRRSNADQALAASPSALRTIASTFLDNLKHLTEYSIDACYAFISQGELNPQVIELAGAPGHVQPLHRQMTSVFEAVAEGRKSPQTHTPPRKTDYDALTQALTRRGWTESDLQLFSDPRALARAKPDVVCKMVQDWFAAQLSIKEPDVQLRLLVESLRPVVAG